ncbi:DUF1629 domain-containing protein [Nitratireductor aquimarinus]|uniref:imm11 family protein n=1 Tax=Alphaproteobacteria TaxID=28211 RepID=UPI0019D3F012|nr:MULTISPECIES: DUF1629 domain-containing protein [Alphaproteobacteria]MBN7755421.1 DUF1629 domain-containing protein [Nitratireductor aquimarinus]MBY5998176.1 DUF1629 domain-containing protein [Tritonibacter mobilis]MBY6020203.1 DUF1629 domain-containing protein [Nitratireductor sp. DP7N14-4]
MNANKTSRSTTIAKPKKRKFFLFGPDITGGGKGHGLEIVNEDALIVPGLAFFAAPIDRVETYRKWSGFGYFKEVPHIVEKKGHRQPRDMEAYGDFSLISERMKRILETVDEKAFAFAECDLTLADGSKGPTYYLCDVVRELDALDLASSKLKVEVSDDFIHGKHYSIAGGANLFFNEDEIGSAHVFVQPHLGADPICDNILRDACKHEDLKGIRFRDVSKL